MKQERLFKAETSEYGGSLRNKSRHARALPRYGTLYLTLKSSQAVGDWAFTTYRNRCILDRLLNTFAKRFGIKLYSNGNAGNHVHIHMRLPNRTLYLKFIRAFSAALVAAITGHSRHNKILTKPFFDQRPHSRIVPPGQKPLESISRYNWINNLQGFGYSLAAAEALVHAFFRALDRSTKLRTPPQDARSYSS